MGPKEKYNFDPRLERAILTIAASDPRFYSTIGYALDYECMDLPEAKSILESLAMIHRETGVAPSSLLIVIQRLRRRMDEGKVTLEDVQKVSALFDEAEDYGLPDAQEVSNELSPVLRRRAQSEAILMSHNEYTRKGDFKAVVEKLEQASRIGMSTVSVGTNLATGGFTEIASVRTLERLPSGVLELDVQLSEGLGRGQMGVVLGNSGGGKSMYLSSQACESIRRNVHTVYATLELPKSVILARIYANLTGVPVNLILENDEDRKEAERRMGLMAPHIGACFVEEFAPHATTVPEIKDWVNRCEQHLGAPVGCVVVDYADKLHEPKVRDGNEYHAMRHVYEGLRRDVAVAKHVWLWTGSQASRPSKDSNKRIDLEHVADSLGKVRVADLVLTLNVKDDGASMVFYVAKNRTGKARMQVGPIPTDFERGRIVPLANEWSDW